MLQGVPRVQAPVHASSRVSPLEGTLRTNANHGLPTPDKHEGNEGAGSVEGEIELSKPSSAGGEEAACSGGEGLAVPPGGRQLQGIILIPKTKLHIVGISYQRFRTNIPRVAKQVALWILAEYPVIARRYHAKTSSKPFPGKMLRKLPPFSISISCLFRGVLLHTRNTFLNYNQPEN